MLKYAGQVIRLLLSALILTLLFDVISRGSVIFPSISGLELPPVFFFRMMPSYDAHLQLHINW